MSFSIGLRSDESLPPESRASLGNVPAITNAPPPRARAFTISNDVAATLIKSTSRNRSQRRMIVPRRIAASRARAPRIIDTPPTMRIEPAAYAHGCPGNHAGHAGASLSTSRARMKNWIPNATMPTAKKNRPIRTIGGAHMTKWNTGRAARPFKRNRLPRPPSAPCSPARRAGLRRLPQEPEAVQPVDAELGPARRELFVLAHAEVMLAGRVEVHLD